eukprot:4440866-Alexandrium_andersonii.AAC.1
MDALCATSRADPKSIDEHGNWGVPLGGPKPRTSRNAPTTATRNPPIRNPQSLAIGAPEPRHHSNEGG